MTDRLAAVPPRRCSHPDERQLVLQGDAEVARWCGVCGALKTNSGPLESQWLLPEYSRLDGLVQKMRRCIEIIDGALSDLPRGP